MRRLALVFWILASPMFGAHYAVVLNGTPAASAPVQRREEIAAIRQRVRDSHEPVKAALRSRGIRITSEADTFLNAIFIEADRSQIADLGAIPGIGYVAPLKRFHRTLDHAEQLINVPAAWSRTGGLTNAGAGIKIAVIDTGIDVTHPAFQDADIAAPGSPICPALSDCVYTNSKVIVARSYVSLLNSHAAVNSRPDDYSARDRVGHGTAVAMAAAGNTTIGPSDIITGVAPKAFLGNYKVFGSPGVNDFTTGDAVISALEDAYNDGMDIAILSLGAPALSGPLDTGATCGLSAGQICDLEANAVESAVQAGLVVVVAAGNDGIIGLSPNTAALNTIDSPGTAPSAITVGATTNSHNWSNPLTVSGLGTFRSLFGDGPAPSEPVSGRMEDVASVGDPQACTAPPAGSLSGLIALVARGACTFAIKIQNLQTAGAYGAIITNNPGDDSLLTPSSLGGSNISASFIGYTDGRTIRSFLAAHPFASVSISLNLDAFEASTYNQMTSFSSRGPALGGGLKPDVSAVGESLYLAGQRYDPNGELYSANGFLISQGTSFSTPQIAGLAALVKQALNAELQAAFPNDHGSQANAIKSAVVNSAAPVVSDGGTSASGLAAGAGLANAGAAVVTQLIAGPSSMSFTTNGFGLIGGGAVSPGFIQLTNIGGTTLILNDSSTGPLSLNNTSALTISPGSGIYEAFRFAASAPGIYQGFITITGTTNPVNIPYSDIVGDGVPHDLLALAGNGDDGTVGRQSAEGYVIIRVIDQYGVPVTDLPATFRVTGGDGQVHALANRTDNYGQAYAEIVLGSTPGANVYTATAGGLTATFTAKGRYQPTIAPNGVLNGASFAQTAAPGAYISVFGFALADTTSGFRTTFLPVSINNVSVSFDSGAISVPGHLTYVSPTQVNVQVPWELTGAASVQMKVSLADSSGTVYVLPLARYAPALFESQGIAAALDGDNNPITTAHPAPERSIVQFYANGLGPVTNQPASGDPAPFHPLATIQGTVTVTIGGLPATIQFAGLSPGSVGLYQVNAVVPQTGPGLQPVVVSVDGVSSPVSRLPVQ